MPLGIEVNKVHQLTCQRIYIMRRKIRSHSHKASRSEGDGRSHGLQAVGQNAARSAHLAAAGRPRSSEGGAADSSQNGTTATAAHPLPQAAAGGGGCSKSSVSFPIVNPHAT